MSAYTALLERLYAARRFGVRLGLERMRAVLDALGAPDRELGCVVQVGGTNGKGSTVAMLAALAHSGGARVATYTSPHLSTLRERVVVDGRLASEREIVEAGARVEAAAATCRLELTFFELVTAIGLVIIAAARPDCTVLEVGLGGRLDATNAVGKDVAVVTGVAMDHEAILGVTLDAIAREKAGIFRRGAGAVIGASGEPAATAVLVAAAREAGCQPVVVDAAAIARVPKLALVGAHQRANAAAALAVMDLLGATYDRAALATVSVPGRFERVGDVILDGAHNPHGARALAAAVGEQRVVLVVAVSADKDVGAMADALAPVARAVIATRYGQDRALPPEQLAAVFRARTAAPVETAADLDAALAAARGRGGPVLVAGSLFLVGEARVRLLGAPADAVALADPAGAGAP